MRWGDGAPSNDHKEGGDDEDDNQEEDSKDLGHFRLRQVCRTDDLDALGQHVQNLQNLPLVAGHRANLACSKIFMVTDFPASGNLQRVPEY